MTHFNLTYYPYLTVYGPFSYESRVVYTTTLCDYSTSTFLIVLRFYSSNYVLHFTNCITAFTKGHHWSRHGTIGSAVNLLSPALEDMLAQP